MKTFTATLLATALTAAFSSAAMADSKTDTATYKTMSQKAAADYKMAAAKCTGLAGAERAVCAEEAKVARARVELDAVAAHNNTTKARLTARNALVNAEHALARAKCNIMTAGEKDTCLTTAKTAYTTGLADAKADRDIRVTSTAGVDGRGLIANTATTEPTKAAAVDKCAAVAGGSPNTGCLVSNKDRAQVAADARQAGNTVAQKTENMADTAVQKTKNAGAIIADKTERAVDRIADRTDRATDRAAVNTDRAADRTAAAADRAGDRTAAATDRAVDRTAAAADRAGDKTEAVARSAGKVVADSVITTKIKADLFKEPELSAMAIHVETEKGVVMLSGFVDSKADAEKAVRLAKSVDGVTQVKSAIKVK